MEKPVYKKGDIVTDGEYTIVITHSATMQIEGKEINVYKGERVRFEGSLLMAEHDIKVQITEAVDMWNRDKIK